MRVTAKLSMSRYSLTGKPTWPGKTRKKNFIDSEVRKLLQCYAEHSAVLTSKLNNTITAEKKKKTLQSIATEVNAI